MPRQNLFILVAVSIVSLVCYRQADSAHRSDRGRMFDTFSEVLNQIERHYLREVDNRPLFEAALQGMVGKLDPYSAYIGPDSYTEFVATLEQKFGGIGIVLSKDPETDELTVTTPLADSPAYAQGIRAGDIICSIDGESTKGLSSEKAAKQLKGRRGTVKLSVLHKGASEPVDITIGRAVIEMPSVLGDTRDADNHWNYLLPEYPGIGYVRITNFGERTSQELRTALAWLAERDVRGLILDLRNNRGGVFDEAVATCDMFLEAGRIVSTQGRGDVQIKSWDASGDAAYTALPLVILVNQHTASAAEIVAACLQDHDRAVIVGQRTWGKGTVQNVIPLEGGRSVLKLTTASYWRPNGQNIHRQQDAKEEDVWGVEPNEACEVRLTDKEGEELNQRRHRRDVIRAGEPAPDGESAEDSTAGGEVDPQLQRAREKLNELLPE